MTIQGQPNDAETRMYRIMAKAERATCHVRPPTLVCDRWAVIIHNGYLSIYAHTSDQGRGPQTTVMWQRPGQPSSIQGFGHKGKGNWSMDELEPFLESLFSTTNPDNSYNGKNAGTRTGTNSDHVPTSSNQTNTQNAAT